MRKGPHARHDGGLRSSIPACRAFPVFGMRFYFRVYADKGVNDDMEQREKHGTTPAPGRPGERDVLEMLWRITSRGSNAEVRQRDGRLVIYEVKKHIAAG